MTTVNLTEAKNNLSRYVKLAAQGERVQITVHGEVVAELSKPTRPEYLVRAKNTWTREEWLDFLKSRPGVRIGAGGVDPRVVEGAPLKAQFGKPTSEQVIEEREERW